MRDLQVAVMLSALTACVTIAHQEVLFAVPSRPKPSVACIAVPPSQRCPQLPAAKTYGKLCLCSNPICATAGMCIADFRAGRDAG